MANSSAADQLKTLKSQLKIPDDNEFFGNFKHKIVLKIAYALYIQQNNACFEDFERENHIKNQLWINNTSKSAFYFNVS